jgi:hypothetical protein
LEEPAASMHRIDQEMREHSYPEDGGTWIVQTTGTYVPELMSHISDDRNFHVVPLLLNDMF